MSPHVTTFREPRLHHSLASSRSSSSDMACCPIVRQLPALEFPHPLFSILVAGNNRTFLQHIYQSLQYILDKEPPERVVSSELQNLATSIQELARSRISAYLIHFVSDAENLEKALNHFPFQGIEDPILTSPPRLHVPIQQIHVVIIEENPNLPSPNFRTVLDRFLSSPKISPFVVHECKKKREDFDPSPLQKRTESSPTTLPNYPSERQEETFSPSLAITILEALASQFAPFTLFPPLVNSFSHEEIPRARPNLHLFPPELPLPHGGPEIPTTTTPSSATSFGSQDTEILVQEK